ncbi:LTA synthase family protein [Ureibacillus acetophenoni]|uniref:Phosphoglycerol transferase n=1 Tax=Ureibacillus acetophenoni TaxID=614649 RepID=A0A285UF69_9BACL|nr:LTA synthase family protein [Ureibacillus acetophenoni]SOC40038.1 phosphoglycerol transferase [Ureibacillus acetophenoni]
MKFGKLMMYLVIVFILLLASLILTTSKYINEKYVIDEILYYLTNDFGGLSKGLIGYWVGDNIFSFIIICTLVFLPFFFSHYRSKTYTLRLRKKKFKVTLFPQTNKFRIGYSIFTLMLTLVISFFLLGIDQFIKRTYENSTFIEEHYVDGREVAIQFPEEKRNLVLIYLESMENALVNERNGGGWSYTVIPELERLARDNINFSHSDQIGGAYPISNTVWTIAAMVATSSGLPLKIPIERNSYTTSENFLKGAYTLGDVLKKEGYNQKLMVGSDAQFGGRTNYFTNHGDYEIFDYNTAIEEGKMTEDDKVWWGFDDTHLFTWAKDEILELAAEREPFNFTLLTVNTHFPDGYLEEIAEQKFGTQYENVYAHSSKQVNEFIQWMKQQEFYSNTTVVVIGDHLSMQDPAYYEGKLNPKYQRTIYNAFLNTPVTPTKTNYRLFTSLDMYPTILASIGAQIEGERLGLGTNLFSNRRTLIEEYGLEYVDLELSRNSHFYNQVILDGDYFDLIKQAK